MGSPVVVVLILKSEQSFYYEVSEQFPYYEISKESLYYEVSEQSLYYEVSEKSLYYLSGTAGREGRRLPSPKLES